MQGMTKGKQLLPTWVSVVGIIVIVLGIAGFVLAEQSAQEDRRTCQVIDEAYGDGTGSNC